MEVEVQLQPIINLVTKRGRVVRATLRPFQPGEGPGTHCTGGRVGLGTGLDGHGISRFHRDSITETAQAKASRFAY